MTLIPSSRLRRSSTFYVLVFVSLCAAIVFWENGNPSARARSLGNTDREADILGFRPTRVLAHTPGYTFFENIYWQDEMVSDLTSYPDPGLADTGRSSRSILRSRGRCP
jgi:hypothetical protein